jgi:hypothetical protein
MKYRQVALGCALSMLMAIPSFAPAAISSQTGSPNQISRDMQRMPKSTQTFWVVKAIQHKLKSEGYDVGRVDGIWGKMTSAALKKYQMDHGMQASGKVNQETAYLLGLDYNEFTTFKEDVDQVSSHQNNS